MLLGAANLQIVQCFLHLEVLEDCAVACTCLYIRPRMRRNFTSTARRQTWNLLIQSLPKVWCHSSTIANGLRAREFRLWSFAQHKDKHVVSLTDVSWRRICSQDLCSAPWSTDGAMLSSSRGPRRLCCCLQLFVRSISTRGYSAITAGRSKSIIDNRSCNWLESPRGQALKFCPAQRQVVSR